MIVKVRWYEIKACVVEDVGVCGVAADTLVLSFVHYYFPADNKCQG